MAGVGEKEAARRPSAFGSPVRARGDDVNAAARSDDDAAWRRHRACADGTVEQYGRPEDVAARRALMTSKSGAEKCRRRACAELIVQEYLWGRSGFMGRCGICGALWGLWGSYGALMGLWGTYGAL